MLLLLLLHGGKTFGDLDVCSIFWVLVKNTKSIIDVDVKRKEDIDASIISNCDGFYGPSSVSVIFLAFSDSLCDGVFVLSPFFALISHGYSPISFPT